jgi:hypothetical protein
MSTDTHEVDDVTVENETDKAILVKFEDGKKTWIPKSVIHDDSEVYKMGTDGTLIVKRWFAEKEGLP